MNVFDEETREALRKALEIVLAMDFRGDTTGLSFSEIRKLEALRKLL